MTIEALAVITIEEAIAQTELLEAVINRGDKEPSWDGFIYAYKNKYKRKSEMFGRAVIQVKGTTVDPKKQNKTTYQVNYSDIHNYRDDGGALYFVVYIDQNKQRHIFYSALLPYKLNTLLEKHEGKKSFSLSLEEFPQSARDVEDLVINFVQNCQRQSSPTRKNWTIEELTDRFGIEPLQIKYRFTDVYKYKDPFEYLFNHYTEMYVPVEITQQEYPVGAAKLEMIQREVKEPVCANGKQYYSSYVVVRNQKGVTISIGGDILLMKMQVDKISFKFKVQGDLPTQIEQSEFLLNIFDFGSVTFGSSNCRIDIESITPEDKTHIEDLRKKHEWNSDLQRTLDILGVKEKLSFDGWKEKDAFLADMLIKGILYKEPVKIPNDPCPLTIINIGNLGIGVLCEKTSAGLYMLDNMFGDQLNIFLMLDSVNAPTSQFVVLKKNDIAKLSNIDYGYIVDSVKHFRNIEHYSAVTRLALELLSVYDENKTRDALNAVIKITKWLHTQVPEDPYYLLNWYQAVYRKNRKDKRIDTNRLRYLANNGEHDDIRAGANILLGEVQKAKTIIDNMEQDDREMFIDYPIMHLVKEKDRMQDFK